jgi:RNA polymerase sigma factor (sigma-70 family)
VLERPPGARHASCPPHEDDDMALVLRMRAGDEAAFASIFRRHQGPLLSYCRHMLGNQEEAEDALQQAFIRAHRALLGEAPPRTLRPWLYAIARNCCLTAIATRRSTTTLAEQTPSLVGLTERVHERQDLRDLVSDIGRLPEAQRSALLLSELDDLSHEAIATIVGCPVSKVKALVYQARSTLIAQRTARESPCQEIRERLAVARGGELRRGPLRRHLNICAGCRDFQRAVNTQRHSLAAVLPVLPSADLTARILGHGASAGAGVAAGASGGASTAAVGGTGAASAGAATAGVSAAGAGATTSLSSIVGGGLLGKLAVGGTIAALATAGAATVPSRLVHHRPRRTTDSGLLGAVPAPARVSPGNSVRLSPNPGEATLTLAAVPLVGLHSGPSAVAQTSPSTPSNSTPATAAGPTRAHTHVQRLPQQRQALRHREAGLRKAALRRAALRRQAARRRAARLRREAAARRRQVALKRKAARRRREAAQRRRKAALRQREAAQRKREAAVRKREAALRREAALQRREAAKRQRAATQPTGAQSTPTRQPAATTPARPVRTRKPKPAPASETTPTAVASPTPNATKTETATGTSTSTSTATGAATNGASTPATTAETGETAPDKTPGAHHPKKSSGATTQPANLRGKPAVTAADAPNN